MDFLEQFLQALLVGLVLLDDDLDLLVLACCLCRVH